MNLSEQRAKAVAFREMHRGQKILVLPNAWDCLSARIFEEAGFPAIATTSGGIAAVLGYPDGQRIRASEMLQMAGRIAQTVSVPVTA
jgi:2-methylisocitrate lyase-like PEP mutase family enzyme